MAQLVNTQVLVTLADTGIQKQAQEYGALPLEIQESLKRQMTEQRTKVVDAAAGEIVKILENKDQFITANVTSIAALQKQIDQLKDLNASVKKAADYGIHKQNFLPLVKVLGMAIPTGTDAKLTKIPEDFVVPTATVAAQG